ncbi:hypothetical protein M0Q28_00855 [Patescibacteria group bacterium]|jgi:hypothetical protein|nr:hypothetical protein [Patescibacteria group bacterium]
MGYKSFIWLMLGATLAAFLGWSYILFNLDPTEAGIAGFALFYLTLFAACVGMLTLAGVVVRVHLRQRKATAFREVRVAFRHGVLLSSVAILSLALSANGLLNIWWFLGFVSVVGGLEYAALLVQESRRS